jgi:hypothetical protein
MNILEARTYINLDPKELVFEAFKDRALFQAIFNINDNFDKAIWSIEFHDYHKFLIIDIKVYIHGKETFLRLKITNPSFMEMHFTQFVVKKRIKKIVELLGLKL